MRSRGRVPDPRARRIAGVAGVDTLTRTLLIRHRESAGSWEVARPGQSAAAVPFRSHGAALAHAEQRMRLSGGVIIVLGPDGTELTRHTVPPQPPY